MNIRDFSLIGEKFMVLAKCRTDTAGKSNSTEVLLLAVCKPIFQSSPMPQRSFPLVPSEVLLCTRLFPIPHTQSFL